MFLPVVFDRLKYGGPVSIYDDGPRIVIWEMTRATKAALERLAAFGCRRVTLSVDGPDAETHDAYRGVKGAFERTLTAAGYAREAGIDLQIEHDDREPLCATGCRPHPHR
jgi:hypothetical protein